MRVESRRLVTATALALAMLLAALLSFWPHIAVDYDSEASAPGQAARAAVAWFRGDAPGYRFPAHYDEQVLWAKAARIERSGDVTVEGGGLFGALHETGFAVALAGTHLVTGLPYLDTIRFLPSLWHAFLILAVYAAMRPGPGAVPAAVFAALIPSTPRFLGPAYLVPIAFALAWVPAILILLDAAAPGGPPPPRRWPVRAVLATLVVGAFFMHVAAGFAAIALVAGALAHDWLRGARELRRRDILWGLAAATALLVLLGDGFERFSGARGTGYGVDASVFSVLGPVPVALWAIGACLAALAPSRMPRGIAAASFLGAGAFGLIAYTIAFDPLRYATYDRWHMPFFVAAALVAGWILSTAFAAARDSVARRAPRRAALASLGTPFGVAFVAAAIVLVALPAHLDGGHNLILQNRDWEAFTWLASEVEPGERVYTLPIKAPALEAMTGAEVYVPPVVHPIHEPAVNITGAWLSGNGVVWATRARASLEPEYERVGPYDVWRIVEGTARAVPVER